MNRESQNIEWKESWREEYFKWVCGFANAQGGILFIGKKDDGQVKHLSNARKLLEDIPNQARDILGLMLDVNLHTEGNNEYLEIVVEPYPFPISLRGKYYYRSGSTLQELKGAALTKFLLERQGKKWDGVQVPNIEVRDLKDGTFTFFKSKAAKSNRLEPEDLQESNQELLESLHLYLEEEKMLKRGAILLFHPNPEKYVTGAYIKIGFFESDDDLKFQDEVKGNLIEQAEEALDLLRTKYDTATISYKEGSREEKFTFPQDAIREALLNAIAHKDYSSGIPIQISVYRDKIIFWNEGQLPENWTVDRLIRKHPSKPFNPDIANALFRAGYIESWGRGTIKIINACKEHKIAPPIFSNDPPDFQVELFKYSDEGLKEMGVKKELRQIVLHIQANETITNSQVQNICNVSKATATRYLNDLENNFIEKVGTTGVGTVYVLKGLNVGS
ncbi:putative DNA binding domain-containing protein [Antarcticibacterium sp. 1MA-6-2]|uniref:ATP-binding protein n=1 Tax=Antarcticibacterium sp. 1MA-6-2 TaxID=2908210 RepID=UPI001F2380C3|nr:ATP-binding protein [Antarcticibacterium sp. 1MA-6-2]UJH90111.1 putative DNA binding domain-containing protein [Antarcticibacterium sp. 1MA-6-2]